MKYCLSLGDETRWSITSDENTKGILSKFAEIMQLKECDQDELYKLIFCKYKSEFYKEQIYGNESSIGRMEWNIYDFKDIRVSHNDIYRKTICEIKKISNDTAQYVNMWFSLQPIYLRSLSLGGLPFHSGLAELNGKGVLFAANGGTGKSTCCRRLPSYWQSLCDDEVLVVLGKNDKYLAHPFPTWSDYIAQRAENSWDVQYSVPLSAIFFIERAEKDEVIPISFARSAIVITDAAYQVLGKYEKGMSDEEKISLRSEIFGKAHNMAKKIPAFRLRASLDGSFWEEIEKII